MKSLICPFCFSELQRDALVLRCINTTGCALEDDLRLTEYLHGKSATTRSRLSVERRNLVFLPARNSSRIRGVPVDADCPKCGVNTNKLTCPRCHNTLPEGFGLVKTCNIALLGAKNTGKSNYIAVVIKELQSRLCTQFHFHLLALSDDTSRRYAELYERPLFQLGQVISPTVSAAADISSRHPLAFTLNFHQRTTLGARQDVIGLSFFDTAGEDLLSPDLMHIHNRYIFAADGLLILLDPLQIPAVRQLLKHTVALPELNSDQDLIVEHVVATLRDRLGLRAEQQIDVPLAIAFSKVDLLRGVVNEQLFQATRHRGGVNLTDIDTNDGFWRMHLKKWGCQALLNYIRPFRRQRFFGLSALGSSPEHGKLSRGVSAFQVEDPLLWLFYQNGVLSRERGT